MTNIERANRWNDIVSSLHKIERTTESYRSQMLAWNYEKFATEMMLMYCEKAVYEGINPSDDGGLATLRNAVKRHGKPKKGGVKHARKI